MKQKEQDKIRIAELKNKNFEINQEQSETQLRVKNLIFYKVF